MKNLIVKLTICLFTSLLFANCSKDNNSEGDTINETFISAKIDGEIIEFQNDELIIASIGDLGNGITLTSISGGYQVGSKLIDISLANVTNTGTYTLFDTNSAVDLFDELQNSSYVSSCSYTNEGTEWLSATVFGVGESSVTITELNDDYITGTFSFTGVDLSNLELNPLPKKTISEGNFKAKVSIY